MATIVQVCERYAPYRGGVETHVERLTQELVKKGHSVVIVTREHSESVDDVVVTEPQVSVIRIPHYSIGSWEFRNPLLYKIRVWTWILQHWSVFSTATVVQVHDVAWWLLPLWPIIPFFCTFHGWETQYPVQFSAKLQRYVIAKIARATVHIGDWIREFYWDKPTLCMYGAPEFQPGSIEVHKLKNKKIVFIGRLSPDTGAHTFCTVFEVMKKKYSTQITWLGDGELREKCQKLGEVTGMVSSKTVKKILSEADIVCAGSYLSILNAQVLGKPVVALYTNKLKRRYFETMPTFAALSISDSASGAERIISNLLQNDEVYVQKAEAGKELSSKLHWHSMCVSYIEMWRKFCDI